VTRKLSFAVIFILPVFMGNVAYGKGRTSGILPGASPKDALTVDANMLDFFDKEQKLIYSGNVYVVNGPSTLNASRLIIFLEDKKPATNKSAGNDRVKHIDAEGPVKLVTQDQISTGNAGSYDKADNKVYLNGNVTITQNETVITGDRAIYDVTTGASSVYGDKKQNGKIRSIFTPKND
jgi:lipopolysaccharide export system protein LptA